MQKAGQAAIPAAPPGLAAAAKGAAAAIRSLPPGARWLVDCDNDADGLTAAAVTALALLRLGHRFTLRPSRDKTAAHYRRILEEPVAGFLLLDKGTSHAAQLAADPARRGRPVLVVDHHSAVAAPAGPDPADPSGLVLLNPRMCGLDGSRDASGATTAQALALELAGPAALAWAPVALAGAVGDWQHMGGWQGWNKTLVDAALAAGHLRLVPLPAFIGVSLAEALAHARPAIPGLHGDAAAAATFLLGIQVDPGAEVEDLDPEARTRLVSAVAARHLAHGADPASLARLVRPAEWAARQDVSLRQLFRLVDACGREGKPQAALAWLMGDPGAKTEVDACFAAYRKALAAGVAALRSAGAAKRAALQVAWTQAPAYTGMVAGLGITHLLADRARPVAVLAQRPDGLVQASTRGTHEQVEAGLDLGLAVAQAAHAVGAEGGGHPVAAGAVLPAEKAGAFLDALDAGLVEQGFLERMA